MTPQERAKAASYRILKVVSMEQAGNISLAINDAHLPPDKIAETFERAADMLEGGKAYAAVIAMIEAQS